MTPSNALRSSLVVAMAALVTSLVALTMAHSPAAAATLPSGFEDQLLVSTRDPTALAFTPDGDMLIATQPGQLRMYKNGQLLQTPALDISGKICANSERGLLGVAVDPNFSTNKYVYLYYTYNKSDVCPTGPPTDANYPVNRVSRFVMSGDTVDPATEKVLIDNIPSPAGNHNAGDLRFGKDGYLYVSVGDGGCDYNGDSGCAGSNDASRDQHILLGKVLRITRDGEIPSTNPYTGTSSARCYITGRTDPGKTCQETFAWGLRNPFRLAFDPNATGTRFFINDVGQNEWEEIDEGISGADYAWSLCEGTHDNLHDYPYPGDCTTSPYTPPVHEYSHSDTGCGSVTGGAFVPNGLWPASYDGSYLFGDYVCNKIFELAPNDGGGFTRTEFASGLGGGGPVAMDFGPYGSSEALYYSTYANGGEVHRIVNSAGDNQSPTASVKTTSPDYGPLPLTVSFDGSASRDPDGDTPLTYLWDFGDGTAPEETATPTTSHTYTTLPSGPYTVTLKVRDARGAVSAPATVKVFPGNTPPQPTIQSPAPTKLFKVGEQITLQGSATDLQDGQLPDSALSWEVRQWHNNNHWHPLFSGVGNNLTFSAPPPEDLAATGPGNYLEIRLTATNSKGHSKTITQNLQPNRVNVTLKSNPIDLSLQVNGASFKAPGTCVSWEGYKMNVNAPSPQRLSGNNYKYASWSDGGSQRHDITVGRYAKTYTATFEACKGSACCPKGQFLARYYDNKTLSRTPSILRCEDKIDNDWGGGGPGEGVGTDNFSARWVGSFDFEGGDYTFSATADDGIRAFVDGEQVIDGWRDQPATQYEATRTAMSAGTHQVKVEYYEKYADATARFNWVKVAVP